MYCFNAWVNYIVQYLPNDQSLLPHLINSRADFSNKLSPTDFTFSLLVTQSSHTQYPSETHSLFHIMAGMCRGFLDVFSGLKVLLELQGQHLYQYYEVSTRGFRPMHIWARGHTKKLRALLYHMCGFSVTFLMDVVQSTRV